MSQLVIDRLVQFSSMDVLQRTEDHTLIILLIDNTLKES
jgi:hypothetical protein